MPKLAVPLTDRTVQGLKPTSKAYTLADGGDDKTRGLAVLVHPSGAKSWQVRYKLSDGRRGTAVIGEYPEMGLAEARAQVAGIHEAAREGRPIMGKYVRARAAKETRSEAEIAAEAAAEDARKHSFRAWSETWLETMRPTWGDESYRKARLVLRKHLQPAIGALDVRTFGSSDVTEVLRTMAAGQPSLARKAVNYLNRIAKFCIHKEVRPKGHALGIDQDTLLMDGIKLPKGGKMPAVTAEAEIGPLIRAIQGYQGSVVRNALMLLAWTAMRPGTVAGARWAEIDLERGVWSVPGVRVGEKSKLTGKVINGMKMGQDFSLPLPRQALDMLNGMRKYSGDDQFVFMAVGKMTNPHLNPESLRRALNVMGYEGKHTPHGFRAMLRTVMRDKFKVDPDVLEAQLAHAKSGPLGDSYDRATFMDERREVMQRWADWLDELAGRE